MGPILIIALVLVGIAILTNAPAYFSRDSAFLSTIVSVIGWFVSMVVGLGLIRAALAIVDGGKPEVAYLARTDGLLTYIIAAILAGLIYTVGFILCIIPGLIAIFLLQFFPYAIVDGRTDNPVESLKISYEMASKNAGDLLLLMILLFLVNLVGALLCGIGLIVTLPVTAIAVAYAWRWFSRGNIAPQP